MTKLPGLIDVHVHLRDPGQTHKEDFYTGTSAALAGGFTTIIDMPNNVTPITTKARLDEKMRNAKEKTVCDLGFYFGSLGDNFDQFPLVQSDVFGLKLYLNQTTGNFIIDQPKLDAIYGHWDSKHPILVHAEEETGALVIHAVKKTGKRTHFCHVSSAYELKQIIKAKDEGLPITCGICAHHLYLTHSDLKTLGSYGDMKPPLKTGKDIDFIWENLSYVDVIESDHAPHTREEKDKQPPPHGVPGLETTLPLLLTSAHEGKLTHERIMELCFENPRTIFDIPTDAETCIEVDMDEKYELSGEEMQTKCKWTPFEGWKVRGRVKSVTLHGEEVYKNGEVLAMAGSGRVIRPMV